MPDNPQKMVDPLRDVTTMYVPYSSIALWRLPNNDLENHFNIVDFIRLVH